MIAPETCTPIFLASNLYIRADKFPGTGRGGRGGRAAGTPAPVRHTAAKGPRVV